MQTAPIQIDNTTVHASAGSGKTYLLISRVIQLLLNGAEPGSILAITFTRKAAAEMQQRLLQRLFELASAAPVQLEKQLHELGARAEPASIALARNLYERLLNTEHPVTSTTFHAFCQDLLRRFPLEADVPAGFELVEQTGSLQDEAWEALMAEAAAAADESLAPALEHLFKQLSLYNTRQALLSFVQQRSDWWAYTQHQSDALAFAGQRLATQLDIQPDADPLQAFFDDPQHIQNCRRYLDYLHGRKLKTNEQLIRQIDRGLDDRLALPGRYQAIRQTFLTLKGEIRKLKPSASLDKAYGSQAAEAFINLHQQCAEDILSTDAKLAAQHTWRITTAWYRAGHHLLQHYQRIKQEQRLLDFTDLEWKTYLLLTQSENASWVQYKLDNRIQHLLIDEFQDTNPTQWQLVLPLLEEFADNNNDMSNSVFLVGDAKQSIYRFRRAEPRLFKTASQWLLEHMQAKNLPLNKSWRSSQAIIDFVNQLFSAGQLHNQLPEFIPHETVHDSLWGQVNLLPLVRVEEHEGEENNISALRNPLNTPRTPSSGPTLNEGQLVAETIQAMMDQAVLVGQAAKARQIRYSDILILLRSRTHVGEFEHALRQANIPYLGAERGTLLEALEIIDMVRLLQCLASPYNNHALASILRSPLFNLSDAELLRLATSGTGSWFERLRILAGSLPAESTLQRAAQLLGRWQQLAGHLPVHDLLDRIYSEANVLARYTAAFPASLKNRVASNLIRFMELALELDSGRYPSLTRFINRLNELQQKSAEAPDEPPGQGQDDRVRLLSIHEAKGLEAPVVFLVDSARPLQDKTAHAALVDWADSLQQPETFLLTGKKDQQDPYSRHKLASQAELEAREETNLLYVAVTRAQQHLFISGTEAKRNKHTSWYQAICTQYGLDIENVTRPTCLHESAQPPQTPALDRRSHQTGMEIDSRLSCPVPMHAATLEIAPSRKVDQSVTHESSLDEDARQRGIMIHSLLERLTEQPGVSGKQLAQQLGLDEHSDRFQTLLAEARAVLNAPQLQSLFDAQHYQMALNEVPLCYELDGRIVFGIIDRLVIREKQVLLIDYKTHRLETAQYDRLVSVYQPQLKLYAEGIKKMWPRHELIAQLLFTHSATLVQVAV